MATFNNTTSALIYGNSDFQDERQTVEISYDLESTGGFFATRYYEVTRLKVLTPIELEPSDLNTDLSAAIAEAEGVPDVRITCEIEITELIRL